MNSIERALAKEILNTVFDEYPVSLVDALVDGEESLFIDTLLDEGYEAHTNYISWDSDDYWTECIDFYENILQLFDKEGINKIGGCIDE